MRDGALVKKKLPDGRWIYGHYRDADPKGVHVLKDQGWWIEGECGYRNYFTQDMNGWKEIYESDGDPMYLREQILGIFEGADIFVNDAACPEGVSEEIDELYVKDYDRTRVFTEVWDALQRWPYMRSAKMKPPFVRYDVVITPTVERAEQ